MLEFHHPRGRDWVASRTAMGTRLRLYARDYGNGSLVLACGACNKLPENQPITQESLANAQENAEGYELPE